MKIILFLIVLCHISISYSYFFNLSPKNRIYHPKILSFHATSTKSTVPSFHRISPISHSFSSNYLSPSALNFKVSEAEVKTQSLTTDVVEEEIEADEEYLILRRISKNIVPIAASIGFAVTPSSSLAYRLAGATVGGVSGLLAKKVFLDKYFDEAVDEDDNDSPPYSASVASALGQLIEHPSIMMMSAKDIEKIAKKQRVPDEELSTLFTHLFAEMVCITTESSSKDLTELVDILDFASSLDMKMTELGDGFALAVVRISKQLSVDNRGFYSAAYPENILLQLSKVLFLGEKLLGEYNGYYGKRLSTGLNVQFPLEVYNEIITASCKHLFKRCIENVIVNPKLITSDEVQTLREYITATSEVSAFRPANMQHMVSEAIKLSVDANMMDRSSNNANIKNYDMLIEAQSVLGWNDIELQSTIEGKTLPVFHCIAKSVIDEIYLHPEHGMKYDTSYLQERIDNLHIDPIHARVTIMNMLREKNTEHMKTMDKVYTASKGNLAPIYKMMMSYSRTYDELQRITNNIMDDVKIPIPGLPFAERIRGSLYELKLKRSSSSSSVNNMIHDDIFDLTSQQQDVVKKSIALPKLSSWITQCINEDACTPSAKASYQKQLSEYNVSETEWKNTAVDFYYQQVQLISSSSAVPSSNDLQRLAQIREFLDLHTSYDISSSSPPSKKKHKHTSSLSSSSLSSYDKNDKIVSKVHMELFGEKYVKALNECMTPTGVISSDYVDSLTRLRLRLGLSEADSKTLLAYVVRTKMIPLVKGLHDQYEASFDPKKLAAKQQNRMLKKQSDPISSVDNQFGYVSSDDDDDDDNSIYDIASAQKEGGGPNVFMREALNIIDNFQQNFKILKLESIIPSNINASSSTSDDDSNDDVMMPVRATGILFPRQLINLLKHYIITRITERDDMLRQRYIMNEITFATALGISSSSVMRIKGSIAYATNKKVLKNILRQHASLSASDVQQLAILKESLSLSKIRADEIYYDAARGAVIEYSKEMFVPKNEATTLPAITADMAQLFRTQIQSLGLDLQKDTGFNDRFLTYLYAIEVRHLVESGQESELQELQEGYGIPDEKASIIIEAACKRYLDQLLNLALRAAKRYDEADAMKWSTEIIKYSRFLSPSTTLDCDGVWFTDKDKERLLSYIASNRPDTTIIPSHDNDDGEDESVVDRLNRMMNVTKDYVAPMNGFLGLLEGAPNLNQLMVADPDENKKRWAWG